MATRDPHSIRFPLDGLLERLALAGFSVSTRQRLLLWRTLEQFGTAALDDPASLKYRLGPLIATNAEEQETFYRIFDKYLLDLRAEEVAPPPPPLEEPLRWWEKVPRWLWATLLALGLLVGGYLIWQANQERVEETPKSVRFDGPREARIGETAVFYNRSLGFDSTEVRFEWLLQNQETGATEQTFTAADSLQLTFGEEVTQPEKRLTLQAVTADSTYRSPTRSLRVLCADPPQYTGMQAPGRADVDQTIAFTLTEPAQDDLTYTWSFGDGEEARGYAVEHAFAKNGAYTVTLRMERAGVAGLCVQTLEHRIAVGQEAAYLPYFALLTDEMPTVLYAGNGIWLLLLLLVAIASYYWYRWLQQPPPKETEEEKERKQQVLAARFAAADRGPYEIPFPNRDALLLPDARLFDLATALRRRQEGLRTELDIPVTIRRTIEGGGFPVVSLKRTTLPPNYLFLIDEQAPHSHQAQLYRYLLDFLRGQDVHVVAFWYKKDPLRFWNEQYPKGLSLEQVHRLYPYYRLLVLGDGHAMLDPFAREGTALQPEYATIFRRWKNRLLLTPRAAGDWTFEEATIYRLFSIFPSNEAGIQAAMAFLETEQEEEDERARPTYSRWETAFAQADPKAPPANYQQWRRIDAYRDYFKGRDELFRWFRALTVHPAPTWPLTLAIGRAIGAPVTFDNLLLLSRIPWLQGQPLTPRVRQELQNDLDPQTERLARAAVAQELEEAAPAARNSHANRKLQTELATQQFLLAPDDKDHRDTIQHLLDAGALSRRQLRELEGSLQRLTAASGGKVDDFLAQAAAKDTPKRRLRLTPPFFWALLFSVLAGVLGLSLALLNGTERLHTLIKGEPEEETAVQLPYFDAESAVLQQLLADPPDAYIQNTSRPVNEPFPDRLFREAVVTDSAVLLNNTTADDWNTALFDARAGEGGILAQAEGAFRQALALRQNDFPVAAVNAAATEYHRGMQSYLRYLETFDDEQSLREAELIFKQLVQHPQVGDDARHALGLVLYYQGGFNSARVQYRELARVRFFDRYPLRPNLETLLGETADDVPQSTCLPLPQVQWPQAATICVGRNTVRLRADVPRGADYNYLLVYWGDGRTDTLQAGVERTHTYGTVPGNELTVEVRAYGRCQNEGLVYNSTVRTYPVAPPPVADFQPGAGTTVCPGDAVNFTATGTGADTYQWDFGNGQTSTAANPEITFTAPGLYTVTLIARNSCGADTVRIAECIEVLTEGACREEVVRGYQFAGAVVDGTNAQPLSGVTVRGPEGEAITDARGQYTLTVRTEEILDEVQLTFDKGGYQRFERSVRTARPGTPQTVTRIPLMPARNSGDLQIIERAGRVGLQRKGQWVQDPVFNNIEYDAESNTYRLQIDDPARLEQNTPDNLRQEPPRQGARQSGAGSELYFGLADGAGEIIIPLRYRNLRFPREGLIAAETSQGWGYLAAETGEIVLSHAVEYAESFQDGRARVTVDDNTFFIDRQGICLEGCPDAYLRSMLEGYLQNNYADMDQAREALLNHPQLSPMLEASFTSDFLGDPSIGNAPISPEDRRALNRLRELFENATDLSGEIMSRYRSLFDRVEGIQDAAASPPNSELQTPNSNLPLPNFVDVPGGTFTMGCLSEERDGACDDDEKPAHKVTVSGFAMSQYEITVGQYLAFADETGDNYPEWLEPGNDYNVETGTDDYYKSKGYSREAVDLPIVGVSWNDAVAYAEWLSEKTGDTYRLPTEAEWEYAARGGEKGALDNYLYAGSNDIDAVAWYDGNSDGGTHPVGQKQPNQLGLYDMSGNVYEWCFDLDGYYPDEAQVNPRGPDSGLRRVLRGGGWSGPPWYCRVADRGGGWANDARIDFAARRDKGKSAFRYYALGFRLVRSSR